MAQGEQLVVQYLNCVMNQSWLQQYGRVRMLFLVRASTADKLLAVKGDKARHRLSVQVESTTEVMQLIANKSADNKSGRKSLITFDNSKDIFPSKTDSEIVLLQLDPLEESIEYLDEFEYILRTLFILRTKPLRETLGLLGPGALEDLGPKVPQLLDKKTVEMEVNDFKLLAKTFALWPFKPELLHDFYEEVDSPQPART